MTKIQEVSGDFGAQYSKYKAIKLDNENPKTLDIQAFAGLASVVIKDISMSHNT
jgi:hypothetical protein